MHTIHLTRQRYPQLKQREAALAGLCIQMAMVLNKKTQKCLSELDASMQVDIKIG